MRFNKDANPSIPEVELYQRAVDKWGQDMQVTILIEELIESIGAVIDFQDPGIFDRLKKSRPKSPKLPNGLAGVQGLIDAMGMTIAQYIQLQTMQIKSILKVVRDKGISIYNEPFDMGMAAVAITKQMLGDDNEFDDEPDSLDPREHLADELADVEIMIGQVRHGMGLGDLIDERKRVKLTQLQRRIEADQ
jgi:hypothetical protein